MSTTDSSTTPPINAQWWPATKPHFAVAVFIFAAWGSYLTSRVIAWLTASDLRISIASTAAQAWTYVALQFALVAALCWFSIGATDLGLTKSALRNKKTWKYTYLLGILATTSGIILGNIVVAAGATVTASARDGVEYVPLSIMAGPTEELAVAGMIILMERARWHGAAIYTTIISLRVVYHLYYGLPVALSLSLWAAGFAWLFLRYRNVTALATAHLTHNMVGLLLH